MPTRVLRPLTPALFTALLFNHVLLAYQNIDRSSFEERFHTISPVKGLAGIRQNSRELMEVVLPEVRWVLSQLHLTFFFNVLWPCCRILVKEP